MEPSVVVFHRREQSTCVVHIGVSWVRDGLSGSVPLGCTQEEIYQHALFNIPNQCLCLDNSRLSSPPSRHTCVAEPLEDGLHPVVRNT